MYAGITGTSRSFTHTYESVTGNNIILLNVLSAISQSGFKPRVIFPSTRLVYMSSQTPLQEESPKQAKTIYAANKIACELYLEAFNSYYDLPYTVIRIGVPYGNVLGTEYSYGTIGFMLDSARRGGPINLYGAGEPRRTFTHIEDVSKIACSLGLMSGSECHTINMPGESLSLYEAASMIASKFNVTVNCSGEWPQEARRVESGDTVFSSEKIFNLIGLRNEWIFSRWVSEL
jgi:UDP-glucose 4-epimerase